MASQPNPPVILAPHDSELDEKSLSYDEGWALLLSLEGSMKGWFPEEGGASGVFLREREAWGE
jgi:hypothetical protein